MSEQIRLQPEVLERFARDLFVAAGLPQEWAAAEAEVLVWADRRGLGSHGVLRIPSYLGWMERGLRKRFHGNQSSTQFSCRLFQCPLLLLLLPITC